MFSLDQAAVRKELANRRESFNVVNLVEHRHRDDASDSGNRLQAKEVVAVVNFDRLFEILFQLADRLVVMTEHRDIRFHAVADSRLGERFGDALAVGSVLQSL